MYGNIIRVEFRSSMIPSYNVFTSCSMIKWEGGREEGREGGKEGREEEGRNTAHVKVTLLQRNK